MAFLILGAIAFLIYIPQNTFGFSIRLQESPSLPGIPRNFRCEYRTIRALPIAILSLIAKGFLLIA